jgi:two-component system LytT family response regulator
VVFLTAYEQFALDAFDVDAVDYLLKPVRRARFARCMERVRDRVAQRRGEGPGSPTGDAARTVVVSDREGEQILRPEEIDWIEADDYYAVVHAGGRRHLVRESLTSLEARLPEASFLRVHRSALVNLSRVHRLEEGDDGTMQLALRSGALVPVSRRRRAEVGRRIRGR